MKRRLFVVAICAGALLAPASTQARSFPCKSDPTVGYSLRVAQTDCPTGRAVQRALFNGDGARVVQARGRTWRCSTKVLTNFGYDPVIFGDRVTGRVLCRHIVNADRFVRWFFHGGGD